MDDGNDFCPGAPHRRARRALHCDCRRRSRGRADPRGQLFGWLPALIWILLGAIFVGGVHDAGALMASIRHRAVSITQVVREHMSRPAYVTFLLFVWVALVYVVIAFADVTAGTFVAVPEVRHGRRRPADHVQRSTAARS
ncbi:MAG: carbon starvation CstA family protein [Rubrivivax sp.]